MRALLRFSWVAKTTLALIVVMCGAGELVGYSINAANATVSSSQNAIQYSGNGTTTAFAFPYPYFAATDLQVTLFDTTANVPVTPAPVLNGGGGNDYTVTGVAGFSYPSFNVVEFASAEITFNVAPVGTDRVILQRNLQATQLLNLLDNSKLPASSVNAELDKLTMLAQQLAAAQSASIQAPSSDPVGLTYLLPAAAARANGSLGFDAQGNVVVTGAAGSVYANGVTQVAAFPSIAALRLNLAPFPQVTVSGYAVAGDGGAGGLALTTDASSADDGCLVFVDAGGHRYKRASGGAVSLKQCGAVGDGVTDDTVAAQRAFKVAYADHLSVRVDGAASCYLINATLYAQGTSSIFDQVAPSVYGAPSYPATTGGSKLCAGASLGGAPILKVQGGSGGLGATVIDGVGFIGAGSLTQPYHNVATQAGLEIQDYEGATLRNLDFDLLAVGLRFHNHTAYTEQNVCSFCAFHIVDHALEYQNDAGSMDSFNGSGFVQAIAKGNILITDNDSGKALIYNAPWDGELQLYSVAPTGNTHTSTTVDTFSAMNGITVGAVVSGSGVPANDYVTAVGGSSVTLAAATTSSLTGTTLTFTPPLVQANGGPTVDPIRTYGNLRQENPNGTVLIATAAGFGSGNASVIHNGPVQSNNCVNNTSGLFVAARWETAYNSTCFDGSSGQVAASPTPQRSEAQPYLSGASLHFPEAGNVTWKMGLVYLQISASNYVYYVLANYVRDSSVRINVIDSWAENNTAGFGAPTLADDTAGGFKLTNANYTSGNNVQVVASFMPFPGIETPWKSPP